MFFFNFDCKTFNFNNLKPIKMKKPYLKNVLVAGLSLLGLSASAQVATLYTFSQQSGVYTPIPYTSAGATVLASANEDDNLYGNVPIGFTFNYNNVAYTMLNLNVNGWIAMGPNTQFSDYAPVANGIVNAVAFWARDLKMGPTHACATTSGTNVVAFTNTASANYFEVGDLVSSGNFPSNSTVTAVGVTDMTISANATSSGNTDVTTTGQISYLTSGTAPNRVFTIQWRKAGRYNLTSAGYNDYFNAQVKLYETTNIIEVVYGKCGTANSTTSSHQIGLSGSSSADYNLRDIQSSGSYGASTPGTANSSSCYFAAAVAPTLGLTYRWTPPQCSGNLVAGTATANILAPCLGGSSNLSLQNTYTVSGITYTWNVATLSNVGPYTPAPNGNGSAYTATNVTGLAWYQLVATCLSSNSTVTSTAIGINVASTTTNTVPYYEGFEGIVFNNQLPNCSWLAPSLGTQVLTYTNSNTQNRVPRTGNKFASFYYSPAGTNYVYTNGIQLYAGVTYSAAMFFTTEYNGYYNFDLAMMVGPNQSTTGLVNIATLNYAASPSYKLLDNTFTVPTSGLYYIAIKVVSNTNCCGAYLSWDDLSVTIPCNLNTPSVAITANSGTICAGQPVNLTANGADTYTWTNGPAASTYTDFPNANITYVAVGTNSITNCTATASKFIKVNPTPQVSAVASATNVCENSPVNMFAVGATNYTWNVPGNPLNGNMITITPTVAGPATYSVIGANASGCSAQALVTLNVNALPSVAGINGTSVSCAGDNVNLIGTGAVNYQWTASNLYVQGTPITVSPTTTTTYTLTGTDANGCSLTVNVVQNVATCTGLKEFSALNGLNVYPNPNNGSFEISLKNGQLKTVEMLDVTGRTVLSAKGAEDILQININGFANGIYYAKIKSEGAVEVIKIVKQ